MSGGGRQHRALTMLKSISCWLSHEGMNRSMHEDEAGIASAESSRRFLAAEAADRAVPGHWEGDLIIGKGGKSAVGTLVERTTRFLLLLHLPDGREAEKVSDAMAVSIRLLPEELRRSIAWDQDKEMSSHERFTTDTGIQVYFCDPHSPWQRPSNENTNGLLRQYMPKGTDLSLYDASDLARIAASLNNRPRRALDYMKPSEKLTELVASTT